MWCVVRACRECRASISCSVRSKPLAMYLFFCMQDLRKFWVSEKKIKMGAKCSYAWRGLDLWHLWSWAYFGAYIRALLPVWSFYSISIRVTLTATIRIGTAGHAKQKFYFTQNIDLFFIDFSVKTRLTFTPAKYKDFTSLILSVCWTIYDMLYHFDGRLILFLFLCLSWVTTNRNDLRRQKMNVF